MNEAQVIARALAGAGVRWAFGIPSGPVLPLIEALRGSAVQYVLTANETSAGFMAATVGAMTGVPGVCISTLGPGATNLATGVGAAWLDRAPVLAITCNVATPWLDRRVQMRIDHHALFAPITKASLGLRRGNVAAALSQALATAIAEPPGPVHLDLPEDVALAAADDAPLPAAAPVQQSGRSIATAAAAAVAAALARSRRPLLVGGLDLTRSRATGALLAFIERQRLPYLLTMHAKGFLPERHPQYAGVLGRARRSDVQALVARADLVIAVGFDPVEINYEEWLGACPLIHIGRERGDAGPEVDARFNAGGDLDAAIAALAGLPAAPNDWTASDLEEHLVRLEANLRPTGGGLAPHQVLDALRERLPADAVLAYDVGAHTHQIATQWRTDLPHTCVSTNGWSSMGYGLPAAFAAKLVHPDRWVVAVVGDGCFQMTAGELMVARRLGLAVPVVVLNDGWLSLLRIKQQRRGFGESGVHLGPPAAAPPHYFGVPCRGARTPGEVGAALDWALAQPGPTVVEAFVDPASYETTVYD